MEQQHYQVGDVAARPGVSVRTLHQYDASGLLRPSGRSEAGYRLYSPNDLLCLQQILTLRYLGFPLKQIRELLSRPDFDLVASLRIQRHALRDRISTLQRIDSLLDELVRHKLDTGSWAWELVNQAASAVQEGLERQGDKMSDYYSADEMRAALAQAGQRVTPDDIRRTEEQWAELVRDVRAGRGLDVTSPEAQALADRWNALVGELNQAFSGDAKLAATIAHNYETDAYTHIPNAPTKEDFAFIGRVNAAREGGAQP
ncbi:MAG: MerR family transcriptional regulator [Ktedonobacterales bacterium]